MQAASPPQQQLVGVRSCVGPADTDWFVSPPGKLTSLNVYDGAFAKLSGYSGHFTLLMGDTSLNQVNERSPQSTSLYFNRLSTEKMQRIYCVSLLTCILKINPYYARV